MLAPQTQLTAANYYADPRLSNSKLSTFIESPKEYHWTHNLGRMTRKVTAAMELGTIVHSVVLEGVELLETPAWVENIDSKLKALDPATVVQIPSSVLSKSGSKSGAAWKEFAAENDGKTLLKESEYADWLQWWSWSETIEGKKFAKAEDFDRVMGIVEALRQHEAAAELLFDTDGETERILAWDADGVQKKAKLDVLRPWVIADLKTTDDPRPAAFAGNIVRRGYHRQGRWYQDGVLHETEELLPVVLVAVRSTAPFEVETYELTREHHELAQQQIDQALAYFKECQASGRWESKTHGKTYEAGVPNWAKYQQQWEVV